MKKRMLMLATTAAMIEQFNKNNILILENMGYEVHVAGNWEQGNPISDERLEKFKRWITEHHGKWFQISATRKPTDLRNNIRAYRDIIRLINIYKYEFIHCHTPIGSVIGRIAAKRTKTKIIYTAHGFHFFKGAPMKNWLLYFPIEWICSWMTDVLITINHEDYECAGKYFHMKKLMKVPGVGIDLSKYGCSGVSREEKRIELGLEQNTVVFFSAGELIHRKNHATAIRAIAKLKKESDIKVKYFIAGKGYLERRLRKMINSLGVGEEVELLGFREDVSELCAASDIYLFPSSQEGLSVALMEAMASKLPCIVSDIRGNRDLIEDGKGGFLVDPYNENDWAEKLQKLISDKQLRTVMGSINRNAVKKFDVTEIGKVLKQIYL